MTNDEVECQDFQLKITLSVLSKHCYLIIETTLQDSILNFEVNYVLFFFFSVTNHCSNNNGGCSQLCLLTPIGRKCLCSEGLILKQDGKTCHGNIKRFTIKFNKPITFTVQL